MASTHGIPNQAPLHIDEQMPYGPILFSITVLALLMTAAWRDVATRTIPDAISLLLVVAGALARIREGPSAFAVSAATALLLFALLSIAYSRGLLGGGDVKLMTALAVGLPPLNSYRFVVATAIAGSLLGIVYLLLSRTLNGQYKGPHTSLINRVTAIECWRIHRRASLPYGVAIAAGEAFVLLHFGSF
jgi:prepilin peptidase CpaA